VKVGLDRPDRGGGVDLAGRPEITGGVRGIAVPELALPDDCQRRPLEPCDRPAERTGAARPGARELPAQRRNRGLAREELNIMAHPVRPGGLPVRAALTAPPIFPLMIS
jgi:hypothetical protein